MNVHNQSLNIAGIFFSILFLGGGVLQGQSDSCSTAFTSKNNACFAFQFASLALTPDTAIINDGMTIDTFTLSQQLCVGGQNDGRAIYGLQGGSCNCNGNYNQGEGGIVTFIWDEGNSIECTYVNGVLPVSLISFNVTKTEYGHMLKWQTATEVNNDYFSIQRSINGIDFEEIGVVKGNGNSSDLLSYDYEDLYPNTGVNYYRLVQYDFDGQSNLSALVAITKVSSEPFIFVHKKQARFNAPFQINRIEIFSVNGQLLYQNEAIVQQVDLQNLPNGMYVALLHSGKDVFPQKIYLH